MNLGLVAQALDRPVRREEHQLVGKVRLPASEVEDGVGAALDPVVLQVLDLSWIASGLMSPTAITVVPWSAIAVACEPQLAGSNAAP